MLAKGSARFLRSSSASGLAAWHTTGRTATAGRNARGADLDRPAGDLRRERWQIMVLESGLCRTAKQQRYQVSCCLSRSLCLRIFRHLRFVYHKKGSRTSSLLERKKASFVGKGKKGILSFCVCMRACAGLMSPCVHVCRGGLACLFMSGLHGVCWGRGGWLRVLRTCKLRSVLRCVSHTCTRTQQNRMPSAGFVNPAIRIRV